MEWWSFPGVLPEIALQSAHLVCRRLSLELGAIERCCDRCLADALITDVHG